MLTHTFIADNKGKVKEKKSGLTACPDHVFAVQNKKGVRNVDDWYKITLSPLLGDVQKKLK